MNRTRREKRHRSISILSMDCKQNDHFRCVGKGLAGSLHFHCGCGCHTTRQINLPL